MTKQWTADHVALASAVELARAELRAILPKLPIAHQQRVGFALTVLNHGLKARHHQPRGERTEGNGALARVDTRGGGGGPNDLLTAKPSEKISCTDGVVVAPKTQGGANCRS